MISQSPPPLPAAGVALAFEVGLQSNPHFGAVVEMHSDFLCTPTARLLSVLPLFATHLSHLPRKLAAVTASDVEKITNAPPYGGATITTAAGLPPCIFSNFTCFAVAQVLRVAVVIYDVPEAIALERDLAVVPIAVELPAQCSARAV